VPILSRVSPLEPTVDETIVCSPRAPGVARRAFEELGDAVDPGVIRDAQLLVSEVVTNCIKHSGSDDAIRLRVWARRNGVKVEVADGGFGFNAGARADARNGQGNGYDEGGRGLLIVEALADRWGTSCDMRARVWFELSPRA
jgi:anti-sigma regulatory factor (Ser/Thr protein kinase)